LTSRRRFLAALALSIGLSPAGTSAQPKQKPPKIGVLGSGGTDAELRGPEPTYATMRAFLSGMRELGYRYGETFVVEARGGEGRPERYEALARELVAAGVDVIVAAGPTVDAVRRVTARIPVVMVGGASDPVGEGFIRSLAVPGGNITGLTLQQTDVALKRLELLKELVPAAASIAVLWEETSRGSWEATQRGAASKGWNVIPFEIASPFSIGPACAAAKAGGARCILVASGAILFSYAARVVDAISAAGLPAVYALRTFVDAGGLISYGADLNDLWRRATGFVDRIIRGESPANMPVEQPTKFELVVNMKAANALGIAIPQSLLLGADEVIR
jgi:putative ABC transport system substrate-binding protein